MNFERAPLADAWIIDIEPRRDDRGYFARVFCQKEFKAHGINSRVAQSNISFSAQAGTMRGLHYQLPPAAESKLMRCVRGAIYDVMIDLRPESPTYLESFGIELTEETRRMVYVPGGMAHGFLTLTDATEVIYMTSEFYSPELERGIRYNDPTFRIRWPIPVKTVTDKDRNWPLFRKE